MLAALYSSEDQHEAYIHNDLILSFLPLAPILMINLFLAFIPLDPDSYLEHAPQIVPQLTSQPYHPITS